MDGTVTSALTAVDPHTLPKVADIDVTDGSLDDLRRGGVIIAEQVATERGLGVGDALPMTFARTGQQRLPIVGLLEQTDAQALSTNYIVSLATVRRAVQRAPRCQRVRLAEGRSQCGEGPQGRRSDAGPVSDR
jgi:putative ABC transport system permease protein